MLDAAKRIVGLGTVLVSGVVQVCHWLQVAELQRLDSQVREQLMLSIQHADRLVAGRISKQQYLDLDGGVRAKRDELCAKMEGILGSLWMPIHCHCQLSSSS